MAGSASEESGVETSSDEISTAQQLCRSSEALAAWRSSEQVESGSPSISPPYWDTDDDDDCGPKPSELYGRYTWKIDRFSQINKRELRSNAFEVGSYKWYILIYPQGCDVCNHLSLFLCVANHDKLNPGWSHFAQFTIAVVNKDPKKSKYSDTLHRFWKKEHDWGWKKFMELSKVLDGFLDDDTLIIKAQVQIIRERVDRPFRCLDCQYRRELVRVYLSNVEQICRRFVEERRAKLGKMMEDKVRWSSFRAFWLGIDPIARRCMSREKAESVLKVLVKHFFIEKEVTSTLVMDSLNSGFKALQGQTNNSKAKGKYVVEEEEAVPIVCLEKDAFILVDDVLLLLERAAMEPLPPMDEKGPQNRTKDVDSGEDFSKDSIERDEMRLTELGRRTIEIFVLAHIFSSKIEVAYQEAVAFKRQEELIREEAAWLAESEQKMRRGIADKDKKSKKKQGKQKRNNRKVREKVKYEKPDIVVEDKAGCKRNAFLVDEAEPVDHPLEDVSDVSDSVNCTRELLEADPEDQDPSPVTWDTDTSKIHPSTEANSSGITGVPFVRNGERKTLSVLDDSSSTCSNDSLPSVLANGLGKGNSVIQQNSQNSLSRGNSQRIKAVQGATGCAVDTNIHPANTSHRGQVIRTLGMAEPDKAVSNSLQHRIKWTEEVAKKEEVVCSQKKSTVTVEAGVGEPITAKTTGIQSSSKSPLKNLSSAVQSNSQSKTAAAIDSVLVRKSSCLSAQRTDKMPITENLAECIIASKDATTVMSRLTDKPITQLVPSSNENSNIGMSGTTEKPIAQPKTEKPNATQPGILRPVSAPSIARTEVCTPAVPIVQTAQSLSRSVSAAGRLGGNPSPATTSHLPQSYRNIMMGDHATRGHSLTQSPNLEVNTPHSYLQPSAVVSAPMYLSQNSERLDTNSIRSNLSFGILNQDVLQDGPQWMESPRTDSRRSHCNSAIQSGTQWMENHQRDTIRNINEIRSLCSDIQNFHMDRSIQSISQDQYPFGYSAGTLGRHNVGVLADDFPHLDIINNLLDEEHGFVRAAATNSAFQPLSNTPHHLNQQFTMRGDIGLSADLVPSTRSGMFEQTQSFYDNEYYYNYNSASDQFNSNLIHQAHIQPCQNGYIDELIPNQWQIGNSNLSYPSMRRSENDDFSYHIPEYSNLVSGVNGYTVFLPSSG